MNMNPDNFSPLKSDKIQGGLEVFSHNIEQEREWELEKAENEQLQTNLPIAEINKNGGLGMTPPVRVERILNRMADKTREIERSDLSRRSKQGQKKHKRGIRTLTAMEPYRPKALA